MFQRNKFYWETGTVDKQIGSNIYIVNGPRFTHKRQLNQIRKRYSNTVENNPRLEDPMDFVFDTFDFLIPQTAPQLKIQKKTRNNGFKWDKPKTEKKLTPYGARLKSGVSEICPMSSLHGPSRDSVSGLINEARESRQSSVGVTVCISVNTPFIFCPSRPEHIFTYHRIHLKFSHIYIYIYIYI